MGQADVLIPQLAVFVARIAIVARQMGSPDDIENDSR
jgi:hypothetical protein